MKVEIWFDFTDVNNYRSYQNFIAALNTFLYKDDVEIAFKSFLYENKENYLLLHQLVHFARREQIEMLPFVSDIFSAHFNDQIDFTNQENIISFASKHNLDQNKLTQALESKKFLNILDAHSEHAKLKRISSAPEYRLMFNISLSGYKETSAYRQALITMYEKDSNIEYCEEDDCIRLKK